MSEAVTVKSHVLELDTVLVSSAQGITVSFQPRESNFKLPNGGVIPRNKHITSNVGF